MVCDNSTLFNMTRFIVLETTVAVFTAMMFYLVVGLIVYEGKKPGKSVISLRHPSRLKRSSQFALAMRLQSLMAAIFTLGRLVCENYELVAQFAGVRHDYCNAITKTKVALTAAVICAIYTFLWTRQRYCYAEPAIQHLSRPTIRVVSWVSLGVLVLAQVVGIILFLLTRFYQMTPIGCLNYKNKIDDSIPWIFVGTVTVLSQIVLFFLFVYPLLQHKKQVHSNSRSGFASFASMIKRVAIVAAICISTDLIALLLILFAKDKNEIIPTLAYDVSLVINVVCVTLSFSDWRARFNAPLCCPKFKLLSDDSMLNSQNRTLEVAHSTAMTSGLSSQTEPELQTQTFSTPNTSCCFAADTLNIEAHQIRENHRKHAWK